MAEERVLICTRVADMGAPQVPARVCSCDKCGAAVWVAESSPKATPRCYACAMLFLEPEAKLGKLNDRQKREIKELAPVLICKRSTR